MTSSDWNSDVYLKYTNFRVYVFREFWSISQNFLLNGIRENKYTLKMHKIHISQNTWKNIHIINSARFLESTNNRSITNQ